MAQNDNIPNDSGDMTQDEMLSSILQKLAPSSQGPPQSTPNPTGDILSSLLSNPELIAKLPTIISSVKPILDMLGMGSSSPASSPVSAVQTSSTPASVSLKQNSRSDSRTALLSAMKPYLSPERQNAIDYIVKLGRLGDILKTL